MPPLYPDYHEDFRRSSLLINFLLLQEETCREAGAWLAACLFSRDILYMDAGCCCVRPGWKAALLEERASL